MSDVVAPTVPDQADDGPTEAEDTAAMLIDHEYRLTLMELGPSSTSIYPLRGGKIGLLIAIVCASLLKRDALPNLEAHD